MQDKFEVEIWPTGEGHTATKRTHVRTIRAVKSAARSIKRFGWQSADPRRWTTHGYALSSRHTRLKSCEETGLEGRLR